MSRVGTGFPNARDSKSRRAEQRKPMPGRKSKTESKTESRTVRDGDGASVAKAVAVLRAFIDRQQAWGVRQLANALGQPGSSIHRLLQILRKDGLVEWDPDNQKYRSGMELF